MYGPSPVHVALNSFFIQLLEKKAPMLPPGGTPVAYVEGVADAHLAALSRGRSGERYLLADEHVSNAELARAILAYAARTFRFTPLIAPGQLSFVLRDVSVDASKAKRELGFEPTPLAKGVAATVDFLRGEGLVSSRAA